MVTVPRMPRPWWPGTLHHISTVPGALGRKKKKTAWLPPASVVAARPSSSRSLSTSSYTVPPLPNPSSTVTTPTA